MAVMLVRNVLFFKACPKAGMLPLDGIELPQEQMARFDCLNIFLAVRCPQFLQAHTLQMSNQVQSPSPQGRVDSVA